MTATGDKYGLFWNSVSGDRKYNAESFEAWLKKFFVTGVFKDGLMVTPFKGMTVSVSAGYCNINGIGYFPESMTLTLASSGIRPRIDSIVAERDDSSRKISIRVVTGSASASPVPRPPVRSGGVYQLVLAHILVKTRTDEIAAEDINDTRANPDICGLVTGTLDGFAKVAKTGKYDDLYKKPDLAEVATSGDYRDLLETPSFANVAFSGQYRDLMDIPVLANAAYSGDYNDLIDLPPDGGSSVKGVKLGRNSLIIKSSPPPSLADVDTSIIIGANWGEGITETSKQSVTIGFGATASHDDVVIGYNAKAKSPGAVVIGCNAQSQGGTDVVLGCNAYAKGSSIAIGAYSTAMDDFSIQLGDNDIEVLECAVPLTVTSDERDKADLEPLKDALGLIRKLEGVTYADNGRWNYESPEAQSSTEDCEMRSKYGIYKYDKEAHLRGLKKGGRRHPGLLAQDIYRAMEEIYGDGSFGAIVSDNFQGLEEAPPEGAENQLSVAYLNLVPFLIGAVNELTARLEKLRGKGHNDKE